MAAETVTIPVTFGAWTDLMGAATEATLQVVGAPVYIHVGASAPATNSTNGLQLNSMGDAFQLAVKSGEQVFARSVAVGGSAILVIRR